MAINKRRLRALVKMIDELPEGTEWNMRTWHCPLGYAARDTRFTSKGYTWYDGAPRYKDSRSGMEATVQFFGIDNLVYYNLFLKRPYSSGTREAVAARITKYVDGLVDHRRAKT